MSSLWWLPARLLASATGLSPHDAALLLPVAVAGAAVVAHQVVTYVTAKKVQDRDDSDGSQTPRTDGDEGEGDPATEGIEGAGGAGGSQTEAQVLTKRFKAACGFMRTFKGAMVPTPQRLSLYALYKQAELGECTAQKPSLVDITGRSKWDAWKALGAMPKQEAKVQYIRMVTQIAPLWENKGKRASSDSTEPTASSGGGGAVGFGMSTSVSTMSAPEEPATQIQGDIFAACRKGNLHAVAKLLESEDVNQRNDHGETPLHYAADCEDEETGVQMVDLLVSHGANVNVTVPEVNHSPIFYALISDNQKVAVRLIKAGADLSIVDEDGMSALDMCDDPVFRRKLERLTGRSE